MGKSTISMAVFNSFLYVYQRVFARELFNLFQTRRNIPKIPKPLNRVSRQIFALPKGSMYRKRSRKVATFLAKNEYMTTEARFTLWLFGIWLSSIHLATWWVYFSHPKCHGINPFTNMSQGTHCCVDYRSEMVNLTLMA